MAIRSRQIQPDRLYRTPAGDEFPVISQEALAGALIDGATMLDLAGGTLTIVTQRAPTGVPNERVTVAAILEWKDRTTAKPQEEATVAAPLMPFEHEEPSLFAATDGEGLTDMELADHFPDPAVEDVEPTEDNPDGFDHSQLEDEDVSEIPAEAR